MSQPERTPYCHKIRYGVSGAPDTTGMEGSYASGLSIDPTLVELVYSTARDGKPASLSASVRGWVMRDGVRVNPDDPDDQMLVHFKNGPDGWPAWLAAEARLHDPERATAPPVDRAALRERIAAAIIESDGVPSHEFAAKLHRAAALREADAVLAVLPEPADRAAVLREAADALWNHPRATAIDSDFRSASDVLRRLAGETPATEAQRCPSCDHEAKYHAADDGRCWFTVDHGLPGSNLVCPCAPRKLDADETPTLRERHRAAWNALTPAEQAARIAALDAIDGEAQRCDGCGHPEHPANECPDVLYGERCACDEPITAAGAPQDGAQDRG